MLTDYYKHLRSANEIRNYLVRCGMENIEAYYAGDGVEARSMKMIKRADALNQSEVLIGLD